MAKVIVMVPDEDICLEKEIEDVAGFIRWISDFGMGKDAVLLQLDRMLSDPVPLLNLPESERVVWMEVLFSLAEKLEDYDIFRNGGMLAK